MRVRWNIAAERTITAGRVELSWCCKRCGHEWVIDTSRTSSIRTASQSRERSFCDPPRPTTLEPRPRTPFAPTPLLAQISDSAVSNSDISRSGRTNPIRRQNSLSLGACHAADRSERSPTSSRRSRDASAVPALRIASRLCRPSRTAISPCGCRGTGRASRERSRTRSTGSSPRTRGWPANWSGSARWSASRERRGNASSSADRAARGPRWRRR